MTVRLPLYPACWKSTDLDILWLCLGPLDQLASLFHGNYIDGAISVHTLVEKRAFIDTAVVAPCSGSSTYGSAKGLLLLLLQFGGLFCKGVVAALSACQETRSIQCCIR